MIVVCEPICKAFSHEKVNSGFLLALRLAFPAEAIRVYADESHIIALNRILENDKKAIDNLEFRPIQFGISYRPLDLFRYRRMLGRVCRESRAAGVDRVFFLSFNSVILFLLKSLKWSRQLRRMAFTLVLHGDFEDIADDRLPSLTPPLPQVPVANRIRNASLWKLPGMAVRYAWRRLQGSLKAGLQAVVLRLFPLKRMLEWRHSPDFRYIALSPHILVNARKYLDVEWLNMSVVAMPIVFADASPMPRNPHPKFAVFGYGDSAMLHQVLKGLSVSAAADLPYEIRIIGMDDRGVSGFHKVTTPSPGRPMSREEMEAQAGDIDAFMIFYTSERYRLSCSGSIFEALSYMKPVLHMENECVNEFNKPDSPIGLRAESTDEFVNNLVMIIQDYGKFQEDAVQYRRNILRRRAEYGMETSTEQLRQSLV